MKCPSCGVENPEGQRFCGECGASMSEPPLRRAGVLICPNCGFANPEGRRYCTDCGSMIPRTATTAAPSQKRKENV